MKLRLSSRDSRAVQLGRPVALINCESNTVVECFKNHADAMRARVLLEQVGVGPGRNLDAAALHQLAGDVCFRLNGARDFERLSLARFNELISAIRTELRWRR